MSVFTKQKKLCIQVLSIPVSKPCIGNLSAIRVCSLARSEGVSCNLLLHQTSLHPNALTDSNTLGERTF